MFLSRSLFIYISHEIVPPSICSLSSSPISHSHHSFVALKQPHPVIIRNNMPRDGAVWADGELAFCSRYFPTEIVIRSLHPFSSVFVGCFLLQEGPCGKNALISRALERTYTSDYTSPFSSPLPGSLAAAGRLNAIPLPARHETYWAEMILFFNLQLWVCLETEQGCCFFRTTDNLRRLHIWPRWRKHACVSSAMDSRRTDAKMFLLDQCFPTAVPRHSSAPWDNVRCAVKKYAISLNWLKKKNNSPLLGRFALKGI